MLGSVWINTNGKMKEKALGAIVAKVDKGGGGLSKPIPRDAVATPSLVHLRHDRAKGFFFHLPIRVVVWLCLPRCIEYCFEA